MLTLAEVAAALPGARLLGQPDTPLQRVHTDTRTLQAGDLFVALRGERFDAHDFLHQAATAGASAALAERGLGEAGLSGVEVADSRLALGTLAAAWRQRFTGPLIAVTGSNGKTTTTQMLASVLRAHWGEAALATAGNFNNDIGVPLTLLPAGGVAVFPADEPYAALWAGLAGPAARLLRFSATDGVAAEVTLASARWTGAAWAVQVHSPPGELNYTLALAGLHNVRNSLATVACALGAGVPVAAIEQGIAAFTPVKGRSRAWQAVLGEGAAAHPLTVVDDTYNANPDSVRAAIDVLISLPAPRLLVLGDFGEVGEQGPAFHAEVGAYARERGIDQVLTLGDLTAETTRAFAGGRHFTDFDALRDEALAALPACASVLVKGSRFMKMERVIAAIEAATRPAQEVPHAPLP